MVLRPDSSVELLQGVGRARSEKLAQLGIHTVYDLLTYFPRAWEDRTRVCTIQELQADRPACFTACVTGTPKTVHLRKGLDLTTVPVEDQTGHLKLTFFNRKFSARDLQYGSSYVFYGTISSDSHGRQMLNPVFESPESLPEQTRCVLAIYPLTAGISNRLLHNLLSQALNVCLPELPEILPEKIQKQYALCSRRTAFREIHMPKDMQLLHEARRRLIFEELFLFSVGLDARREARLEQPACVCEKSVPASFYQALPFSLTGAQRRVIDEIQTDMASGKPMFRLVQGDTGCGKTMVAAAAVAVAAAQNYQSVLMAPAGILAEQHYQSLAPLLEAAGVRSVLLTSATPASERRSILAALAEGTVQLAIGTHALLQERVIFKNLALVITDEQQRFGVGQRAVLAGKGLCPHILLMSATPIPRTLALVLCGDMDISVIDELPPGRKQVDTFLVSEAMRQRVYSFARKQAEEGHQVFIVCPLVEEHEADKSKAAVPWALTLKDTVFQGLHVAVLHGRMQAREKETVMQAFSQGKVDILISTTIIETGVDVPAATLMIIEGAEHFGLSQLHQLRGRVGRGQARSYCVLITGSTSQQALKRLKALTETDDGFRIAEEDLKLRGPGDYLGTRQHGLPGFKCASLSENTDTLLQAREAAAWFLENTCESKNAEQRQEVFQQVKSLFPDLER